MTRSNCPNEASSKSTRELRNASLRLGPTNITDPESQQGNISPWTRPLSWLWQVRPHHGREQHLAKAMRHGPDPIAMLAHRLPVKLAKSEKTTLDYVTNEISLPSLGEVRKPDGGKTTNKFGSPNAEKLTDWLYLLRRPQSPNLNLD